MLFQSQSVYVPQGPLTLENVGLTASVGSNALTLTLVGADGNPLSSSNYARVAFRDPTNTNGNSVMRNITAPVSITVPSTATLGHANGINSKIYVYLIDNAGSFELGVTGGYHVFTTSVRSSTAISTSADLGDVLYSTSAVSNKAIRLVAILDIVEATAGAWVTAPSIIRMANPQVLMEGNSTQVSATSDVKTPGGSARYLQMTNNSVTLPPGEWEVSAWGNFNNSGVSPGYSTVLLGIFGANGADNSSEPTLLSATSGLTVQAGYYRVIEQTSASDICAIAVPALRLLVSNTVTVYAVPFSAQTTSANARVTAYIYANKVR